MLVIPLINHENDVIGVLQLINKMKNNEIITFDKFDEKGARVYIHELDYDFLHNLELAASLYGAAEK